MKSLAYKILEEHLLEGDLVVGEDITIKIDQTLTQDSTGTMVYLQLEAIDPEHIKTQKSVAYIDHNMLQTGFENADDHAFIKSVAEKRGIVYSKPGGGICHQVHLEQFTKPGITLLGSDSHTPTGGGMGAIAIGAGGLDVAVAMAMGTYNLSVPKVKAIKLSGKLNPGINAKDVILTVLQKLTVKGGVGYIIEYTGDGVLELSLTDRATITNMGAELGATTSIFPSDERTLEYLKQFGREEDYIPLSADPDAVYDEVIEIDLSDVVAMAAMPHSPDNVKSISEIGEIKVDQVAIGSCTNSSFSDMMKAAKILEGNKVHPDVDMVISPGSASILNMLSENGALSTFINAGARILECGCGPCIGMGQSPKTDAVSLRTFNRNFMGRSGTMSAGVYLVSPETAAISAIKGKLTDPKKSNVEAEDFADAIAPLVNYFVFPQDEKLGGDVIMGPNIKAFPLADKPEDSIEKTVLLKTGDNVTTDDICPSHAKLLPFRSNVPHLSKFAFTTLVDDFYDRAKEMDGGIIVGGQNYGQGSSREHAALVPLYLGVKAVIAKSFARIHRSNLINSGILPLVFQDESDYDTIDEKDELLIEGLYDSLENLKSFKCTNKTKNQVYQLEAGFSERERDVILAGGYINYLKGGMKK